MTTYAIGDIQGCYSALTRLLETINFQPKNDQLWLAGDLVNRGEDSLATLRMLKGLGDSVSLVLGNHDLHLIAIARGHTHLRPKDTLAPILHAPDCNDLIDWLRQQPLMVKEKVEQQHWVMTHAGIYPLWKVKQARRYAAEVEAVLQSDGIDQFLAEMYGNQPQCWDEQLTGTDRLRFITNAFTRMRFVGRAGELDMANKTSDSAADADYQPWFQHPTSLERLNTAKYQFIFGHWAALEGQCPRPHIFALDTGCVWGGQLTALRLEDQKLFQVAAG